ncbi:cytochrome b [Massilia terrae]|uniref:Cytochrome b n=1 Tax=Massilia terrae TaxID=1811224 RepID=A0ABT2D6H3_9BURK|nr:cytochrome b [Massilia terrae]MCS0660965.1 cytochrome b [Massilia terrae]
MPRYSLPAIVLHWLIALFIIGTFILGLVMTDIPGLSPTKLRYFSWHKWLGVTVLGLAALRLLWRLAKRPPPLPAGTPGWQQQAAHWMHILLYVLIVAVPVSGYAFTLAAGVPVVYFGVLPLPVFFGPDPVLKPVLREVHYWLDMSLAALVLLHVAAALKHQFIDRDGLLARMSPFGSTKEKA